MTVNDTVLIHSTPEFPTTHEGKGTVWKKDYMRKPGFYLVLVWKTLETAVFHESQLTQCSDNQ